MLVGQRIGHQGFGGALFKIYKPSVIRTKHEMLNGYLFTSRKMQIMNSRSFYMKQRLGTSDQINGSFGSTFNSTATESSSPGQRLQASEMRRSSCRTGWDGYDQRLAEEGEEVCFRDFALILTNKTRIEA